MTTGSPPPLANFFTKANALLGRIEHLCLAIFLGVLVFVGAGQAIARYVFSTSLPGSETWIRAMVYFVAMTGAALAAGSMRMIRMDIAQRMLSPKARAWIRVFIAFFVVATCCFLVKGGWQAHLIEPTSNHLLSSKVAVLALPIGALLIAVHYALLAGAELSYLVSGRVNPEIDSLSLSVEGEG